MKAIRVLTLAFTLFILVTGIALANGVERPRDVLGSGLSDSVAGDVILSATVGQPVVGVVLGEDIALGQGFWYGSVIENRIYLPLLLRN
jgi:hypothetical protein